MINNLLTSSVHSLQENLKPPPWCINLSLRFPCNDLCAQPQSVSGMHSNRLRSREPNALNLWNQGCPARDFFGKKKKTDISLSHPRAKEKYQRPLGCASYLKQSPVYDTDSFNFDWVIQKWEIFTTEQNPVLGKTESLKSYCAFHKHANSKV